MKPFNTTTIYVIRITAMLACVAFAGWTVLPLLPRFVASLRSDPLSVVALETIAGILFLTIPAAFIWLAWRLWYRWNTSTVRWFVGVWMAMFLIWLDAKLSTMAASSNFQTSHAIGTVLAIPLMIIGATAFQYICRTTFRYVGLQDVFDIYGQSLGHQSRIQNFAGLLGWAIWFAGNAVYDLRPLQTRPPSWTEAAGTLGPIILGYSTYKFIVWYSKPRTQPVLPAGGFEVITSVPTAAHGTTLT